MTKQYDPIMSEAAFSKILKDHFTDDLVRAADEVADSVKNKLPDDVPVEVSTGVGKNGRPYSMVTIAHPSGIARQIKNGTLTRSAAELGYKIRRYDQ